MSETRAGWFSRLKQGLARSSARLSDGIAGIFTKRRLDDATLGELKATFDSSYGPITSNWKVDGTTMSWDVVVPPNTTALLSFPSDVTTQILEGGKDVRQSSGVTLVLSNEHNAIYETGAGSYSFTTQR